MRGAAEDAIPVVVVGHGRVLGEAGKAPCPQTPVQVHCRQGWSTAPSSLVLSGLQTHAPHCGRLLTRPRAII